MLKEIKKENISGNKLNSEFVFNSKQQNLDNKIDIKQNENNSIIKLIKNDWKMQRSLSMKF